MDSWRIGQTVDIAFDQPGVTVWPRALMIRGDDRAHSWRVRVLDGGAPADLTGCTVAGYFIRADGATVVLDGTITGNTAQVTLTQECYAVAGSMRAVMRLTRPDGAIITLSALMLSVQSIITDAVVVPGATIPSLADLIAQISAMEAATAAAITCPYTRRTASRRRLP